MQFDSEQKFVLWGALSSHQQLLFRSPKIGNPDGWNIDILFDDIGFLQIIPTLFGITISIAKNDLSQNPDISNFLKYPGRHLFLIESNQQRYFVAAGHFIVYKNKLEFSEPVFSVTHFDSRGIVLFDSRNAGK